MLRNLRRLLKRFLYIVVFYTGLLKSAVFLLKRLKKNHPVIILFYHRFHQGTNGNGLLPSDEIEEFKKQMLHLKKFYTLISMDELAEHLKHGSNLKVPAIALTIDDGYLSNYTLAYPILRKYHIPCMIYLTVGSIGSGSGLWIDDIEYALMNTKVPTLSFQELFGDEIFDISSFQLKIKVIEMLYFAILKKGNLQRQILIQKLFDILNVDISKIEKRQRIMLDWDEIIEMSNNGITFGAHTLTHPFLPAMTSETAKYEIRESKITIEKYVGEPVKHFAIPNGRSEDFTNELKAYCNKIGFDTIVTTEPGVVDSRSDRLALKRMIFPPPLYYFACEIARHFFF